MGHANNIITAPVDVYGDIAALFGIASGDVGYLITHAPINKWAKYKPQTTWQVPEPVSIISDAIRQSANWGLTVPTALRTIGTLISGYTDGYQYLPVTKYRVLDFVKRENDDTPSTTTGYNHNAKGFVTGNDVVTNSNSGKTYYYINYTQSGVVVSVDWYRTSRNDEIGLSDILVGVNPATNAYFGVIVVNNNALSNKYRLIVGTSIIGSDTSSSITIPESVFTYETGNNFSIYPIFSLGTQQDVQGAGKVTDTTDWDLIALPDITIFNFTVKNAEGSMLISIPTGGLSYTVDFRGRPSVSMTANFIQTEDIGAKTESFTYALYVGGTQAEAESMANLVSAKYENVSVSTTSTSRTVSWDYSEIGSTPPDWIYVRVSATNTYAITPRGESAPAPVV